MFILLTKLVGTSTRLAYVLFNQYYKPLHIPYCLELSHLVQQI